MHISYTCQLFQSAGVFENDTIISEDSRRSPKSSEGEVIEKTLIHKIRDREEGVANAPAKI